MKPFKYGQMDFDNFKKVINQLSEGNIFYIIIGGGEPFLVKSICRYIDYACQKIEEVSVITNGTLVNERHLSFLKEKHYKNLHIQVSLDSIVKEENQATRGILPKSIIRKIIKLRETEIKTSVGIVITRFNYKSIIDTIKFLSTFTKYFNVMVLQDTTNDPKISSKIGINENEVHKIYNDLLNIREENGFHITLPSDITGDESCSANGAPCAACFSYFTIDPDMTVRPCDRITTFTIGDLSKKSIKEIWNCPDAINVTKNYQPICFKYIHRIESDSICPD